MLCYVKFYLCLIFLSCGANAIPLEDSQDVSNQFGLAGLSENNATGAIFIEGDIAVPLKNGRTAYVRSPKWPNGIVPIEFHSSFSTEQKNTIIGAMSEIMKDMNNCIRYVWRTADHPVWIRIFPGQG